MFQTVFFYLSHTEKSILKEDLYMDVCWSFGMTRKKKQEGTEPWDII